MVIVPPLEDVPLPVEPDEQAAVARLTTAHAASSLTPRLVGRVATTRLVAPGPMAAAGPS